MSKHAEQFGWWEPIITSSASQVLIDTWVGRGNLDSCSKSTINLHFVITKSICLQSNILLSLTGLAKSRLLFVLSRPPAFTGFNRLLLAITGFYWLITSNRYLVLLLCQIGSLLYDAMVQSLCLCLFNNQKKYL